MGKFKGYLKKASGTFKQNMWIFGLGFAVLNFVGCMTSVVGMAVNESHTIRDYKATSLYQDYTHEQQVAIEDAYNNGELTLGEYMKKVDDIEENTDVRELINRDIEGNEEFQARLKSVDQWKYSAIALGALTAAGFVTAITHPIFLDKIDASGAKDLAEAEEEFKNAAAGIKPEPKPKKVKLPKFVEIEVSDDEELKSIDEYYNEDL